MPFLTRLRSSPRWRRPFAPTGAPAGDDARGVEIAVSGLCCRFAGGAGGGSPGHPALDDLDLVVRRGEVTAVVGPSGAGKTTLLRVIAGLTAADRGKVRFDGVVVDHLPPERRELGVVFQSYALFPHLTVRGNVGFALRVRGASRRDERRRVGELLERMAIAHLAERHPHRLSGGERQRAALARALAAEPRALLLDEPLAALDAQLRATLRGELAELLRRSGLTALYVTHDQEEAMALGDRVAVLRAGRIEQVGTPEELYRRPVSELVAGFFGEASFVDASWDPTRGWVESPLGVLELAPSTVTVPAGAVRLVVRPGGFLLDGDGSDADRVSSRTRLDVRVRSAAFLGDRRRLRVEVPGLAELLTVDLPPRHQITEGEILALRLDPAAVSLLPAFGAESPEAHPGESP